MLVTTSFPNVPLGDPVPPYSLHAVSVSLPTWRDNVDYELGEERVLNRMTSGYPRFFIPLNIQKLASICEQKYSFQAEKCLLVPSRKIAHHCRSFIENRSAALGKPCTARCVEERRKQLSDSPTQEAKTMSLYIVLFPSDAWNIAKEFWQHTGLGISSRFAENFLSLFEDALNTNSVLQYPTKMHHRHYSVKCTVFNAPTVHSRHSSASEDGEFSLDHNTYLEERYGRNLPLGVAATAKRALRRRLAGVLIKDVAEDCAGGEPCAGQKDAMVGPSSRGVTSLAEDDVYLLPTGMSAIWSAHQCLLGVGPQGKSVCFGFPYTDTLKILQKWGPGCHFFGHGLDSDIEELEKLLEREQAERPDEKPILALFTEFPSNPLLRSANLPRLRELADKYGFAIVVDETIGSIVNVEVVQYADIIASSLTKIFSGDANVMGGCLVLNPQGKYYHALKKHLEATFEDIFFNEDAIYLERNSRDFKRRIRRINVNTEAVCDFLRTHSIAAGHTGVIKEVFYPKYITPENYEWCRKKGKSASPTSSLATNGKNEDEDEGGYGGLFSLTFTSKGASEAFFDALECFKGPSLGTNFTLACPYTILAHFGELDWAAGYGVEEGLVRVSIGMEDKEDMIRKFEVALRAAERAHTKEKA
ncbi:hypothetical protein M378DRAFT_80090 [Amanita muscaria Koide BX008]|uniref:cystathionine gamma-synthase n=1 Tax=Amanita muscaria (strain Koide BX008) TaxID=946122 RepID=A0A0C2X397_AMAMK|nr:hypothetical protein M378DRAFT_80090 [Amanita muscaria Koide BX008]